MAMSSFFSLPSLGVCKKSSIGLAQLKGCTWKKVHHSKLNSMLQTHIVGDIHGCLLYTSDCREWGFVGMSKGYFLYQGVPCAILSRMLLLLYHSFSSVWLILPLFD